MEGAFDQFKVKNTNIILFRKKKSGNQFKGSGGFRPVVNWREISLKKKLVDKKVLVCILATGSLIILAGCFLLFLGLFVINRQCPFNWLNFIDDTCLYVSSHNATWASSRHFCADQGGNLVDVADINENNQVKDRLRGPTWIALFRPQQKPDFEWASGSSKSYRNWASTPSGSSPTFTQCVRMSESDGRWHAENDCNKKYFAACEYKKSYYPLVLIGPIIIVCGVLVLILSIENCHRVRKAILNARAKGLVDNEEIPEEDTEHIKPMTPKEEIVPPWRSNKTSPLAVTPSKSPHLNPSSERSNRSNSRTSSNGATPRSISERKGLNPQTDLMIVDDESNSQEQLELLLTPKNLK